MALMAALQVHLHPIGTVSTFLPTRLERGDMFLTEENSSPRKWKTTPRTRAASRDQLSQACATLSRRLCHGLMLCSRRLRNRGCAPRPRG